LEFGGLALVIPSWEQHSTQQAQRGASANVAMGTRTRAQEDAHDHAEFDVDASRALQRISRRLEVLRVLQPHCQSLHKRSSRDAFRSVAHDKP